MTCKECIHHSVCGKQFMRKSLEPEGFELKCRFFNRKADFVSIEAYKQVAWERDTAIEQLKSYGVGFCENKELVEVVRCKECKHWRRIGINGLIGKYFGYCLNNEFPFMCETRPNTKEDDFCSYGERRDT